jgi:hypothetical protein
MEATVRIRSLVGALILGTAAGASAQAVGPTVTVEEAPSAGRAVPAPALELGTRPAPELADSRVAEQLRRAQTRVGSDGPDRLGRWLMAAGATLVVAGLADWVADDAAPGLGAGNVAAYGAGVVLFGYGAQRTPPPPPVLAGRPAGPTSPPRE